MLRACIAVVMTALAARPAAGQLDLLFRQAPDQLFGQASDSLWLGNTGQPTSSLVADNFRLAQDENVCGIGWWAFYGSNDPYPPPYNIHPPATETLRLRFYSDSAGLPGAILWEQTYTDHPRVRTGRRIGVIPNRDEYYWFKGLTECFPARANTPYWLEVAQMGDVESEFRWESSYSDNSRAVQFPIGAPWALRTTCGMAFELRRTPEPASAACFFTIFALPMLRRASRPRDVDFGARAESNPRARRFRLHDDP